MVLVMLAARGERPAATSAGKLISVPPPASAFTAPAAKPASAISASCALGMSDSMASLKLRHDHQLEPVMQLGELEPFILHGRAKSVLPGEVAVLRMLLQLFEVGDERIQC